MDLGRAGVSTFHCIRNGVEKAKLIHNHIEKQTWQEFLSTMTTWGEGVITEEMGEGERRGGVDTGDHLSSDISYRFPYNLLYICSTINWKLLGRGLDLVTEQLVVMGEREGATGETNLLLIKKNINIISILYWSRIGICWVPAHKFFTSSLFEKAKVHHNEDLPFHSIWDWYTHSNVQLQILCIQWI